MDGSFGSPFYDHVWDDAWQDSGDLGIFGSYTCDVGFHCYHTKKDSISLYDSRKIKPILLELSVKGFVASGFTHGVSGGCDGVECETWKQAKIKFVWERSANMRWRKYTYAQFMKIIAHRFFHGASWA